MTTDTSEKGLETLIVSSFVNEAGYEQGVTGDYNREYAVDEFAPGLVLLGTDGGDTGYGVLHRPSGVEYVRVPLVGLSVEGAEPVGKSVTELLGRLGAEGRVKPPPSVC